MSHRKSKPQPMAARFDPRRLEGIVEALERNREDLTPEEREQRGQELLDERAADMRGRGGTYREIGEMLGISSSTAHDRVQRHLRRLRTMHQERLADRNELEAQKLESLEAEFVRRARDGDDRAYALLLRAAEVKARLRGMYTNPLMIDEHSGDHDADQRELKKYHEALQAKMPANAEGCETAGDCGVDASREDCGGGAEMGKEDELQHGALEEGTARQAEPTEALAELNDALTERTRIATEQSRIETDRASEPDRLGAGQSPERNWQGIENADVASTQLHSDEKDGAEESQQSPESRTTEAVGLVCRTGPFGDARLKKSTSVVDRFTDTKPLLNPHTTGTAPQAVPTGRVFDAPDPDPDLDPLGNLAPHILLESFATTMQESG